MSNLFADIQSGCVSCRLIQMINCTEISIRDGMFGGHHNNMINMQKNILCQVFENFEERFSSTCQSWVKLNKRTGKHILFIKVCRKLSLNSLELVKFFNARCSLNFAENELVLI